ncbi:hypothetical protein E2986_04408 [Frieseomelitta varia]|uniref:Uncharacterized protein n=1 Tax=Frieseomelitta varia TaxID=561572 RepID=A0A833VUL3_9HYME|nr:hypothetical protein E2986_04408 [Frieseomelitta varia]
MKELSNTSIDYYILPNKIFCSVVGMWPIDEKSSTSSKIFAYFRLIVTVILYSSILVPQIWAVVVNWGNIQTVTARREKARKLYNEMRCLWDSSDDPNEKKSYEQIAYWARTTCLSAFAIISESYSKHFATFNLIHLAIVVDDINNLFTPILFMQLLTSGIEICLTGYGMLDNGAAIIDMLKFMCYFISMTVEILLFCWPSEILVHESEEVGHLSPIHRRHLCLMIIRAQRYCSITALTFKALSIQTLTSARNDKNIKLDYRKSILATLKQKLKYK